MGRGRQKAKQTKVARELKYNTHSIDVTALQRELGGVPLPPPTQIVPEVVDSDDEDDQYAGYADYGDDEDDDESSDYAAQRG